MYRKSFSLVGLFVLGYVLVPGFTTSDADAPLRAAPGHHLGRGFRNTSAEYSYRLAERAAHFFRQSFRTSANRGRPLDILANDGASVRANGTHPTITWVGHSTFLIQLDGINILTDPHWGDRASPVAFAGPRRLVAPGMRFEDLPPVHAVVISHDHYDHLDAATVARIARAHQARFFVPLGVRALVADFGVTDSVELDWWESATFRGVRFVATPAQHSSGRGLNDQNLRLWCSWVIAGLDRRIFFAGDTGYYAGLRQIGDRLGPFDLAAIPIGGYRSYGTRHPNHLNPEEAVQLLEDVRGRMMVPMHWGTFDMNREPFQEPPERLLREAARRGLENRVTVLSPGQTISW